MGGLTFRVKIIGALKENAKFYIIVVSVSVVFIMILLIRGTISFSEIGSLIMALSNIFGLLLLVLLLGHGLVELPRTLLSNWSPDKALQRVYHEIGGMCDDLGSMEVEVMNLKGELMVLATHVSTVSELADYRDRILDEARRWHMIDAEEQNRMGDGRRRDSNMFDVEELMDLQRAVKEVGRRYQALVWRRQQYVKKAIAIQRFKEARGLMSLHARKLSYRNVSRIFKVMGRPVLLFLAGLVFGVLSAMLVWSETFYAINTVRLSAWAGIVGYPSQTVVTTLFWCFVAVTHIMFCMIFSLSQVKISSFYNMVPRHTEPTSLMYNCIMLCRIVASMVYNFFNVLQMPAEGAFVEVLGGIRHIPLLGGRLNYILPMLILPLALSVLFRVYGRVLGKLRIAMYSDAKLASDAYAAQVAVGTSWTARAGTGDVESGGDTAAVPLFGGRKRRDDAREGALLPDRAKARQGATIQHGGFQVATLSALGDHQPAYM